MSRSFTVTQMSLVQIFSFLTKDFFTDCRFQLVTKAEPFVLCNRAKEFQLHRHQTGIGRQCHLQKIFAWHVAGDAKVTLMRFTACFFKYSSLLDSVVQLNQIHSIAYLVLYI